MAPGCAALLAVFALLATACGSSGNKASSGTTTAAGSSSTTGVSGSATGSSYKLMFMDDISGTAGATAPYVDAFKADFKAANLRGGVAGHQIDLITCDTAANDNSAAACGQQAASDHVFGVISESGEDTFFPYLEAAHIPVFNEGIGVHSWSSPVSFIINNLLLDATAGYVSVLHEEGCKSFVQLATAGGSPDLFASEQKGIATESKQFGMADKGVVLVPQNAPDVTSYVTEAINKGAACVAPLTSGAQTISTLKALIPLAQEGKFQFAAICTCLAAPQALAIETPIVKGLSDHQKTVLAIESNTDLTNPLVKQWVTDQTTYGPKPPDLEAISGSAWADLAILIKAADAVNPNVNATNVLNYLNHLHNYWPGVQPPVSFDDTVPNVFGPRNFGAWVAPSAWTDGVHWARTGPFISVLTGKTNNNTGS